MMVFNVLFVVSLLLYAPGTWAVLSDKRLCANKDCTEPISHAVTLLSYSASEEGMLSFPAQQKIVIYSKSAGMQPKLWGAEYRGRRGYVPTSLVKETKVLVKPQFVVDVAPTIEPSPTRKVVDGTTLYPDDLAPTERKEVKAEPSILESFASSISHFMETAENIEQRLNETDEEYADDEDEDDDEEEDEDEEDELSEQKEDKKEQKPKDAGLGVESVTESPQVESGGFWGSWGSKNEGQDKDEVASEPAIALPKAETATLVENVVKESPEPKPKHVQGDTEIKATPETLTHVETTSLQGDIAKENSNVSGTAPENTKAKEPNSLPVDAKMEAPTVREDTKVKEDTATSGTVDENTKAELPSSGTSGAQNAKVEENNTGTAPENVGTTFSTLGGSTVGAQNARVEDPNSGAKVEETNTGTAPENVGTTFSTLGDITRNAKAEDPVPSNAAPENIGPTFSILGGSTVGAQNAEVEDPNSGTVPPNVAPENIESNFSTLGTTVDTQNAKVEDPNSGTVPYNAAPENIEAKVKDSNSGTVPPENIGATFSTLGDAENTKEENSGTAETSAPTFGTAFGGDTPASATRDVKVEELNSSTVPSNTVPENSGEKEPTSSPTSGDTKVEQAAVVEGLVSEKVATGTAEGNKGMEEAIIFANNRVEEAALGNGTHAEEVISGTITGQVASDTARGHEEAGTFFGYNVAEEPASGTVPGEEPSGTNSKVTSDTNKVEGSIFGNDGANEANRVEDQKDKLEEKPWFHAEMKKANQVEDQNDKVEDKPWFHGEMKTGQVLQEQIELSREQGLTNEAPLERNDDLITETTNSEAAESLEALEKTPLWSESGAEETKGGFDVFGWFGSFFPEKESTSEVFAENGDDVLISKRHENTCDSDDSQSYCKRDDKFIPEDGLFDASSLNELLVFLGISGASVVVFLWGYMLIDKTRKEAPLIAKINNLEKALLVSAKENQILTDKVNESRNVDRVDHGGVVSQLRSELEDGKRARASLEEQVQVLEKELETSTEVGLELNRMLSEVLSSQNCSDTLMSNIEQLQRQLVEQQSTINTINARLSEKDTENHELQLELEINGKKVLDLQSELDKMVANLLKLEDEKEQSQTRYEARIVELEKSSRSRAEELGDCKRRLEETRRALELKTDEYELLKSEVRGSKGDVDRLLDSNALRAEVQQLQRDNATLSEHVQQARRMQGELEKNLATTTQDAGAYRRKYEEADRERLEAQTRLDVLNAYFKEREAELQKELSKHESKWLEKEGEATSTVERLRFMQEEIQNFKAQNASLKQEIVSQEVELKSQIGVLEKKAHENWVSARQAERKLEDARNEAAQLRNRLTLRERGNEDKNQNRLLSPLESNGEHATSPLPMNVESPSPLIYGARDRLATTSPPLSAGMHGFLPPPPFMPPPPLPGMPPFMPPPPPPALYPGDRRPPPLGRMSSPPVDSRYSPDSRPYSPYERNTPSPTDDEYYGPPHRGYSPYNGRDRREYGRPPQARNLVRNNKGAASSGSANSNESLEKINRHNSKV